MWSYCRHFQLHRQFWPLDQLGECLIWWAFAICKAHIVPFMISECKFYMNNLHEVRVNIYIYIYKVVKHFLLILLTINLDWCPIFKAKNSILPWHMSHWSHIWTTNFVIYLPLKYITYIFKKIEPWSVIFPKSWTSNAYSQTSAWGGFRAQLIKILVFPSPTGYMLRNFKFSLLI